MDKDYVLYASRGDFLAHRSLGMFTRDGLAEYVRDNDMGEDAIVLETRLFGKLIPVAELNLPKERPKPPVIKKPARPAPQPHPSEVIRANVGKPKRATISGILNGSEDVPGASILIGLILIAGIALAVWGGSQTPIEKPTKPLSQEDQLIRDAVRLQRMIDQGERERQEKFAKEYRRQEREGR